MTTIYAEPENRTYVHRRARIGGVTPLDTLVLLGAIVIFVGLVIAAVNADNFTNALMTDGVEVEAEIIDQRREESGSRRSHTDYFVVYRYQADGVTYERDEKVDRERYNALTIGSAVTIRYLRSDPATARIFEEPPVGSTAFNLLCATFFIVPLTFIYFRKRRRSQEYSRQGVLLDGRLTSVYATELEQVGYQVTFYYLFLSPRGVELSGKRTVKRNDLRDQPLPLYDSPMKVLYIDDEQHRML